MRISERITNTIEDWRTRWGNTLKEWLTNILSVGIEFFFNILGKAAAPKLKPLIDSLEATGKVPPELQPLLEEIKSPTGQIGAIFAQSAGSALIGGAIGKIIDAILLPLAYAVSSVTRNVEITDSQMIALWLRGKWDDTELDKKLSWLGVPSDNVANLKELSQVRLDPGSWITAFRRKYKDFAKIENDLKAQGWDDDRIEALKFFTLYMPSAAEIVHWYAREVYEPEMIDRYGLDSELPNYEETDFPKIGVDPVQAKHHWMAHWEHASFMQVIEMLHRGLLTLDKTLPSPPTTKEGWLTRDAEGEKAMFDWYRLVEIPPFWRDRLTAMSWNVPTRVDVRRWRDMGTISIEELYNIYHRQGYHGTDLDNYVLWTEVYNRFPSLIARFKNTWIKEKDVRDELENLGMSKAKIEEMWQEKFKPEAPARVEPEKALTKSEIYKGIKAGKITPAEGVELLMDMGYGKDEAELLIEVNVGALKGSPETYSEFKKWTQLYRKSQGLSAQIPPQELIEAERTVKAARIGLQEQRERSEQESELAPFLKALSDAEYRYRQLLLSFQEKKE